MAFTVADSGGTGTSIVFYNGDDDIRYLETKALHPRYLLKWSAEEIAEMRRSLPEDLSAPLYFYGAGCSQPGIAYDVKMRLQEIGFSDVRVFSDALGACRACCGNEPGLVAILGTGSVLLHYSGSEISEITGGLGSIIGDEGSGFHFGRLVLKFLFDGRLDASDENAVCNILGSKSLIRAQLASDTSLQFVSQLGAKLSELELDAVHIANLDAFFGTHLAGLENYTLHCVGSYAFYQQEKIRKLLSQRRAKLGTVLRNPISKLVAFHADLTNN